MSEHHLEEIPTLVDASGKPVGVKGKDGLSYTFPYLTELDKALTDSTGTPGAATINEARGRVAIAAAASSVVVTNNQVTANSVVLAVIDQAAADGTLLYIARVVPAAGSFTVYGNAAATAAVTVRFVVLN